MAAIMAQFLTEMLLGKLGSFLADEASLLKGVEDDIKDIIYELRSINAFLKVMSSRQDLDDQMKEWIHQVKEMAYDAEDSIEEFQFSVLLRSQDEQGTKGGFLRRNFLDPLRRLKNRYADAPKLKKIKVETQNIRERHERYSHGSGAEPASTSATGNYLDPRTFALFVEEAQLVGIDEHTDKLCRWLTEENKHPQPAVISLIGIGGLGKTTLARQVYKSPVVISSFQIKAWVAVSQSFDIKTLLLELIKEICKSPEELKKLFKCRNENMGETTTEQQLHKMKEEKLVEAIRDYLNDNKYVIVLDDIWTVDAWKTLRLALPDNQNGSRIIVTSRIEAVGNVCSSHSYNLSLKIPPLSPNLSWQLFCRRVFEPPQHTCPPDLENIGKDILEKCKGLPLAIITIAGLLSAKPNKAPEEWKKFHTHLSTELQANTGHEDVLKILKLSYNDLPYHLKPCFLYLGIYPEDCEIDRKSLIRRWIAEGFVRKKDKMPETKVAKRYADELVNRSLILPTYDTFKRKVMSYHVHDMMLEMILTISKEENFFTLHSGGSPTWNSLHGKVRRLSLQGGNITLDLELNLSHVRSITAFGPSRELLQDYGKFRRLRLLDLEGYEGLETRHLETITKLILLRFLSLRRTNIKELPESIGNMQNLEILDLKGTRVSHLPKSIVKLQRLVHFVGGLIKRKYWLNRVALRLPRGIGQLKTLKKLGWICIDDPLVLQEIAELTRLENLRITFSEEDMEIAELIQHLSTLLVKLSSSLYCLDIYDCPGKALLHACPPESTQLLLQKIRIRGFLGKLPSWFPSLNQIVQIKLEETKLQQNALQVIKDLPRLVHLELGAYSFVKEVHLLFDGDGFASLRQLDLTFLSNVGVSFEAGALPNLKFLRLEGFDDDLFFSGLQNLVNLEEIFVDYASQEFIDMVRENATCAIRTIQKWL